MVLPSLISSPIFPEDQTLCQRTSQAFQWYIGIYIGIFCLSRWNTHGTGRPKGCHADATAIAPEAPPYFQDKGSCALPRIVSAPYDRKKQ